MTFIPDACTRVGMGDSTSKCALCGAGLGEFRYNPMPQWNISGMLCSQCYDKKLLDHYISPDRRGITKK
jgi:hypothetical protein